MKLVRNGKTNPNPQFDGSGKVSLFDLCVITCSFGHVSVITSCLADSAVRRVWCCVPSDFAIDLE